jgi:hypothetical protein
VREVAEVVCVGVLVVIPRGLVGGFEATGGVREDETWIVQPITISAGFLVVQHRCTHFICILICFSGGSTSSQFLRLFCSVPSSS